MQEKQIIMESGNWLKLLACFNREATKAGYSKEWIKDVKLKAMETDKANLEAVLARAFSVITKK